MSREHWTLDLCCLLKVVVSWFVVKLVSDLHEKFTWYKAILKARRN